jgi:hypothetical protein
MSPLLGLGRKRGESPKSRRPTKKSICSLTSAGSSIKTTIEDTCTDDSRHFESNSIIIPRRRVQFGNITIRNYERVMDDNPSCSCGVPVGIGWKYRPEPEKYTIDIFESIRKDCRREVTEMRIPPKVRQDLLRYEYEIGVKEIRARIDEVKLAREKRAKTARSANNKMSMLLCVPRGMICS